MDARGLAALPFITQPCHRLERAPTFYRVAHFDVIPRVGRSQGASFFWGLVSVSFAAAACFYFWKNHENESMANKLREQVLILQDEHDTLNAQKEKLQSGMTERDNELKNHEDFLQDKEAKLAAEETRLEALGQQTQDQSQQGQSQVAMIKKFGETIRRLGKNEGCEVVTHGNRQILRVPNSTFFAPGDATLKLDGKALLNLIAQSIVDQADTVELRVESFADGDAELQKASADATSPKPRFATAWDLTSARAAAIAHFYHDQTALPFHNVLVIGRGDSESIVRSEKDNHERNGRIEFSINPLPAAFRAPSTATDAPPPLDQAQ